MLPLLPLPLSPAPGSTLLLRGWGRGR
jgi:hypothetical protein